MPVRLRHVGIVVSNMDAALKVYTEFLGCELLNLYPSIKNEYLQNLLGIKDVAIKVAILNCQDQSRIELIEYLTTPGAKRNPVNANDIGASHFAVTVADIDKLYEEHNNYDVRFISAPRISPDGFVKVAYVILLDECIVELVQVLNEIAVITR